MSRCLYCYQELSDSEVDFHAECAKKFFGTEDTPMLPFGEEDVEDLALTTIQSHGVVPGAQPKLSLALRKDNNEENGDTARSHKFTIVGLWGNFILKTPSSTYPELPEIEDVTMHLASETGIRVVPHSLIRMKSGNLAYITRRVDRQGANRVHMEDMCQLTGRLTEYKYHGSHEQIAKKIMQHSADPILDVVNFAEVTLFAFLTGNADLHLKNVSLIEREQGEFVVSPYYDLVATALVLDEREWLALPINGKKVNIRRKDFVEGFQSFGLNERQIANVFDRMVDAHSTWHSEIASSHLSQPKQDAFRRLIDYRMRFLGL